MNASEPADRDQAANEAPSQPELVERAVKLTRWHPFRIGVLVGAVISGAAAGLIIQNSESRCQQHCAKRSGTGRATAGRRVVRATSWNASMTIPQCREEGTPC